MSTDWPHPATNLRTKNVAAAYVRRGHLNAVTKEVRLHSRIGMALDAIEK
jgi:hypothetical protein